MQNIEIEIADNRLILIVDLSKEFGFTNSGTSVRIASSEGNCALWLDGKRHPDGIRFNLNVFRALKPDEKSER